MTMARKPNYQFERMERDRAKAAKKKAQAEAKKERVAINNPESTVDQTDQPVAETDTD